MARDARHYLQRGKKSKALDYFKQARQIHPEGGLTAFGYFYQKSFRMFGPLYTQAFADMKKRVLNRLRKL